MARVNITVPDDLVEQAKSRGWNISRLTMRAIEAELDKQRKVDELDCYLAELDAELGPATTADTAAAERWVAQLLDRVDTPGAGTA